LVYFKGKIMIPTNVCFHTLTWYHENLLHPGADWMFHTILQHFTWPSLCTQVEKFALDIMSSSADMSSCVASLHSTFGETNMAVVCQNWWRQDFTMKS
jgi:hypothetical protein